MSPSLTEMTAYSPSRSMGARVRRRVLPLRARRDVAVKLDRPIVCFTFDDVPDSIAANALPLLEAEGWRATLYAATGLMGTTNHHGRMMAEAELRAAFEKGHEIAAHGHAHMDMSTSAHALTDIEQSHRAFADMDLPTPTNFAWPYGQATPQLKSEVAKLYTSMRGISPMTHVRRADLNQLGSVPLFHGHSIARAHGMIDRIARRPGLLTLFTHDVRDEPSAWGCTPDEFSGIVAHVRDIGAVVLTVAEAVERITS